MNLSINNWVRISKNGVLKDGQRVLEAGAITQPQDMYKAMSYSYMKFFKMDVLSKWAWLGAETLLSVNDTRVDESIDKKKVAVVLTTTNGCLDVDKKYDESRSEIPSPALFVYTLPNIMLGEICIRHGYKGEQLCLAGDGFNATELDFWANDLLENRGMDACLCGYVDAYDEHKDVCLFWVTKNDGELAFDQENLLSIYNK